MPIVKSTVAELRAGDMILDESGRRVRVTGIADKPAGKRRLIIEHRRSITLPLADEIQKVADEK